MSISCKKCGCSEHVKNGKARGHQRYRCKTCGCNFIEGDGRLAEGGEPLKALCVLLYGLGKGTFRGIGEICGVSNVTVYRWVKNKIDSLPEPEIPPDVSGVEIDEMWHYLRQKKRKKWILKAVNRNTRRVIAWVVGGRDAGTVRRLYGKLKHLKKAVFYTDDWAAFAKVLPGKRHVIGKEHTAIIERNNAVTRHRLARMTRKTIVVSKAEHMIDRSMKLFAFFEDKKNRKPWIKTFQSIFA